MRHLCLSLLFVISALNSAHAQELLSERTCEERGAIVERMGHGSSVSLDAPAVDVDDSVSVRWSRPPFPEREPIFLMLAFDVPVRFHGKGFYALSPNARAPFEFDWQSDKTRVVIPFFGQGVPRSERFDLEPILTGGIDISWAVIGETGCGQSLHEGGSITLEATAAGSPKIVVIDPDDRGSPDKTLVSSDGTRALQIFEARWRLIERTTGVEIAEGAGSEAVFSPTGRFVEVWGADQGIYDAVDGKKLDDRTTSGVTGNYYHSSLWIRNDSFLVFSFGGYGQAEIVNLISRQTWEATGAGCRICDAAQNASISLDFENNLLFALGYSEARAANLTTGREEYQVNQSTEISDAQRRQLLRFAKRSSAVSDVALPNGWQFQVSVGASRNEDFEEAVEGQHDHSEVVPNEEAMASATSEGSRSKSTNWRIRSARGLKGVQSTFDVKEIVKRLDEFGLRTLQPIEVQSSAIPRKEFAPGYNDPTRAAWEEARMARQDLVIDTIRLETGLEGSAFARSDVSWGCGVHGAGTVSADIDRAFRWQTKGVTYWVTNTECVEGAARFLSPETAIFSSNQGRVDLPFTKYVGDFFNHPSSSVATKCDISVDACGFQLTVSGRFAIFYSEEAQALLVYDFHNNRLMNKIFDLPRGSILDQVLVLEDLQHVLSLQKDGSFFVMKLSDGTQILQGRYVDDEIVVWTEDGRFDATPEGAHFMGFSFPGQLGFYSFSQFEAQLKTPGLVNALLSGREYGDDKVSLTSPPELDALITLQGNEVVISATAKATAPIHELSVFQDGILTDRFALGEASKRGAWEEKVARLQGARWINLVVTDKKGAASLPIGRDLGPGENRRLHVLSIGVDKYDRSAQDAVANLGYAVQDAKLFAKTLSGLTTPGLEVMPSVTLTDHAATPDAIVAALEHVISVSEPGDTVAMFFAGHGVSGKDGKFHLATSNLDLDDIDGTGLSFDRIGDLLAQKDVRVAVFLDACHSGLAGQGLIATNDDAAESVLDAIPGGALVFSAAKGREFALENHSVGGGLFATTFADVVGASRGQYDENKNGLIEVSELFAGVKSGVVGKVDQMRQSALLGGDEITQTPWLARNRLVGDFALF